LIEERLDSEWLDLSKIFFFYLLERLECSLLYLSSVEKLKCKFLSFMIFSL